MMASEQVPPPKVAEHLLAALLAHDDENGALANAQADELRDALRLACDRLRIAEWQEPRGPFMVGARRLVAEVWKLVVDNRIDARSTAADAALDLRDEIDPNWWPDAEAERRPRPGDGQEEPQASEPCALSGSAPSDRPGQPTTGSLGDESP